MSIQVLKFGGTSVGTIEKIEAVAAKIADFQDRGHKVVAVVSAMSGETNRLIGLAKQIMDPPHGREYDVLVSTGETQSMALVSMALQKLGRKARSFSANQFRMITDQHFSRARILEIETANLQKSLDEDYICIVAGFQGIDREGNITTLGRGGSDTTAVAIAAALKAEVCNIYTDVDGVYTTDPRQCSSARRLECLSYEEMLEMASQGSKVLQLRSVEMAAKYNLPIRVLHSVKPGPGTLVKNEDESMEKVLVTGVSCSKNDAKISLRGLNTKVRSTALIFKVLAEKQVNVDMIVQNFSNNGDKDITFTVGADDLLLARDIVSDLKDEIQFKSMETDENVAKISIIGVGMRSHSGVASTMFSTLAENDIPIFEISTSEIKVSCLIPSDRADEAVNKLHDAYELGL